MLRKKTYERLWILRKTVDIAPCILTVGNSRVGSQIFDPAALSQRKISQGTGIWVGRRPFIERVEQRRITYVVPVGKRTRNPRLSILHFNPLKPELNPICYLLALLVAHHFLHVSRIRVKLLTFRLLMPYIWSTHS